ncbi:MAG: NAD nucleotidase [Campylobacterales bacterium]|nr:NAD nucleotidase [Campylobacterales bacterium]
MKMINKMSLILCVAIFTGCATKDLPASKPFKTTIIHINDHHSHIDGEKMSLKINNKAVDVYIGGFARVISKIKELQSNSVNPVTLHAGDALQGTMYYTIFKGELDAKLMNLITWDAFELGNHEFDDGDEELHKFLKSLDTSILASNIKANQKSPLYNDLKPYKIITKDNQKIAIIGIDVAYKTKYSSRPSKNVEFFDEIQSVNKHIQELKAEGINKFIVLSHFGFENDIKLASQIEGVDVIIGGDSHTLMGDFDMVGLKSTTNDYPKIVKSKDNKKVCIAQAWQYSYLVGSLDVEFDKYGDVTKCSGEPILLVDSNTQNRNLLDTVKSNSQLQLVDEDKKALEIIKGYKSKLDKKQKEIVGFNKEYIGHNRIPLDKSDGVCSLKYGSEIAPLIAKSFYMKSKKASFAIQNAGGVRSGLKSGNITIEDVYKLLPFSNTLIEFNMSGKEVKELLEDAFSSTFDKSSSGAFVYGYGIRYDVDSKQSKGNRVSNIEVLNKTIDKFEPMDFDKKYIVVTNSYIADGKDGYEKFAAIKDKTDTYYDYAMSFVDLIKSRPNIVPVKQAYRPIKSFK